MRMTSPLLARAFVPAVMLAGLVTPAANADLYLADHRDADESTCSAKFDGGDASCTITVIGRRFAVGAEGDGLFRVVLEAAPLAPGLPSDEMASCSAFSSFGGCVGASSYPQTPYAYGTQVTCRAYGVGHGTFECSSFYVQGD